MNEKPKQENVDAVGVGQKCGDEVSAIAPETSDSSKTSGKSLSKRAMKRMLRKEKFLAMKRGEGSAPKKKYKVNNNPGFEEESLKETEYYFENGLRKVYPYFFTFTTYAKERWYGRTLYDVFTSEFRYDTPEYVRQTIQCGKMLVNGKSVGLDYTLKNGDMINHTAHRHENPVTADKIEIIESTDDFVVVNKPSSIPVHPCGRYRHNTLVFILGKDYGFKNLRTLYRLDRLTSGVFIMTYSSDKSRTMINQISQRQVTKEYLCRVEGHFPDGVVECNEPLDVVSHKIGLQRVSASGKPASTLFERLSYNGVTSVVKCIPKTGRTHQIRVHLQFLGYPIVNDTFYNSTCWGPEKGKGGRYHKTEEQLLEDVSQLHAPEHWVEPINVCKGSEEPGSRTDPTSPGSRTVNMEAGFCNSTKKSQDSACKEIELGASLADSSVDGDNKMCESTDLKLSDGTHVVVCSNNGSSKENDVCSNLSQTVSNDLVSTDNSCVSKLVVQGDIEFGASSSGSEPSCKRPKLDPTLEVDKVSSESTFDPDKYVLDESCSMCKMRFKDPSPDSLKMYLHALSYKGPGWEFSTPVPDWAKEDWTE